MLKWLFFKKYKNNLINHFLTYGYMVFGCFFIIAVPFSKGDYNPQLLLFVFLINWFNNSFAYLLGKNFGKNKLLPSVSPNKSWEGFWGGLFFSLIAAFILYKLQIDIRLTHILICSILIPVLATLGDLIQSKIKRDAGVKDSGYILPGHGGFYDRMDSIIFIAPWMFFIFNTF
jgi:phosphatidate cytidylyltransferase|tara:strand:- start:812 stop:1330 length:519 start_codon:yes stop_codon:yes gene_type:complete